MSETTLELAKRLAKCNPVTPMEKEAVRLAQALVEIGRTDSPDYRQKVQRILHAKGGGDET